MTAKASTAVAEPEPESEGGLVERALERAKSGDLGSAPILFGVVLIAIFFHSKDSLYLSAGNLSN